MTINNNSITVFATHPQSIMSMQTILAMVSLIGFGCIVLFIINFYVKKGLFLKKTNEKKSSNTDIELQTK